MNVLDTRILPLPPEVAAQIRSSIAITTLQDVVVQLLCNSIDAHSTRVDVKVDSSRGSCVVEDNGLGIAAIEFAPEGSLGKPFCESAKTYTLPLITNSRRHLETPDCGRLWPCRILPERPGCVVNFDRHLTEDLRMFAEYAAYSTGPADPSRKRRTQNYRRPRYTSRRQKLVRKHACQSQASSFV